MATDYWAHWYHEHPNEAASEATDPDFDADEIMRKIEAGEDWEEI